MSKIRTWLPLSLSVLVLVVAAVTTLNRPDDSITRAERARIEQAKALAIVRAHLDPYKGRTPKRALTRAEIDPFKYGAVDYATEGPPNKIYCVYVGGTWIKGHPDPANLATANGHCFDWKVTL